MFGREPVVFMALLRAAIVLGVSFGLKLTEEQTLAIYGLAEAVLAFVTRQKVTPMPKSGGGPGKMAAVSLVLCAALVLPGCALFRNVSSYLTALEDEYGEEFAQMVEIICGRAEAKARRMDDVQEAQQLFCFAEHQLSPYVPIALDAMQRGESRAARSLDRGDQ